MAVALFCHSDLALGARGLPRLLAGPAGRGLGVLQRRALAAIETVLVASRASEERIASHLRAPAIHSPLGIDLEAFEVARPDPALRRRLAPRGPLLLHAGRLSPDKRIDLLAPMLAALPGRATLAVAGAGAGEAALRRAARRAGVAGRIVHLGHVAERAALARLMASADCFVHPNPAEPYGLCPLEALAAGCRVVAPRSGSCAETLAGRGAVMVVPDDPSALAAGVRRALSLPRPRPDLSDLTWAATFRREWSVYRALAAHAAG